MPHKNLLAGVIAFTTGLSFAVASVLLPQHVYVRARVYDTVGPIRCVNTKVLCDDTGTLICVVIIPVSNGAGTQTAKTDGSSGFTTYKAGCETALGGTGSAPLTAIDLDYSIYELLSY